MPSHDRNRVTKKQDAPHKSPAQRTPDNTARSAQSEAADLRKLQRLFGNQHLQRLLASGVPLPTAAPAILRRIQAKLTLGQPDDKYEREADAVARAVMRAPDPAALEEEEDMPGAQMQADPALLEDEEALIQGQWAQRQGAADELEEEEEEVPDAQAQTDLEEALDEEALAQAKPAADAAPAVTSAIETRIEALRGSGKPLPEETRDFMEPRFQQDFSGVNVHDGGEADALNRSLGARAFTTGQDIFFRSGEYNPGSAGGKELLAHELTHVVQQSASSHQAVQRQDFYDEATVDIDPTSRSITRAEIDKLNIEQLDALIKRTRQFLEAEKGKNYGSRGEQEVDPRYQTVVKNLLILQDAHTQKKAGTKQEVSEASADEAPVDKDFAHTAILRWANLVKLSIQQTTAWLGDNLGTFVNMTSSDPELGWSKADFEKAVIGSANGKLSKLVSTQLGDASRSNDSKQSKGLDWSGALSLTAEAGSAGVEKGLETALKKLPKVAAFFGLSAGGVPFVAAVLIAFVVELGINAFFDWWRGYSLEEKAQAIAAAEAGILQKQLWEKMNSLSARGDEWVEIKQEDIQKALLNAQTQAAVDAITNHLLREIEAIDVPATGDLSLYKAMIQDWILEHAGDEEDAAKIEGFNPAQWKRALEAARDPDASDIGEMSRGMGEPLPPQVLESGTPWLFGTDKDLDNHPELFAYQTRLHLKKAGLDTWWAQKMINDIKGMQSSPSSDIVNAILRQYGPQKYLFQSAENPERLIKMLEENISPMQLSDIGKEKIRNNEFELGCKLDLAEDDGSVYVNEWEYDFKLKGDLPLGLMRAISFDISPD